MDTDTTAPPVDGVDCKLCGVKVTVGNVAGPVYFDPTQGWYIGAVPGTNAAPPVAGAVDPGTVKKVVDAVFAVLETALAGRPFMLIALHAIQVVADNLIGQIAAKTAPTS